MRTLLTRGLIEEVGADARERRDPLRHDDLLPAAASGCGSLDELPALAPYLPEVDVLDELAEQGRG